MDHAVSWFATTFGNKISAEAVTFIVSLLPILECRGGLLLASMLKVNLLNAIPLVILGNILPIPFVLLFMRHILNFMRRFSFSRPLVEWLEKRAQNKSASLKRGEFWGLLLFVGIPLPGTGGWTGALVASLSCPLFPTACWDFCFTEPERTSGGSCPACLAFVFGV